MHSRKIVPLGEIAEEITVGYVGPMANEYVEHGVPFLRSLNIRPFRFDSTDLKFITPEFHQKIRKSALKPGDVAVVRTGTPGVSCVIPEELPDANCSDLVVIRPGAKLDPEFVSYYINSITKSHIKGQLVGAIQQHFNIGAAKEIHFPNISRQDQKKLSATLTALDAKIALNHRINSELEGMAKLLYDYWFVQYDFPLSAAQAAALGKPRLAGKPYRTSGGPMVYHDPLKREIPKGWEVGSLLDIATFTNGLACQKFPPTTDEYLRVIKIKEMHAGFTETSEKVTTEIPEKVIVRDGDILFSWSASLEVMIWTGGTGALNQHIFKVTSDDYPRSICYFTLQGCLQHFKMMADLRKTTMGHITREHLEQSLIAIPPKEIGNEFESVTQPIFSQIINNQQQNQELTTLRDWLLPMLMNGQLRVG
jgi:type I restriction enzyme S subunit